MQDKLFKQISEQISELKAELLKLDTAYVVGNPYETLKNLNKNVETMTPNEQMEKYIEIAERIYEIQSQLNQDNCQ